MMKHLNDFLKIYLLFLLLNIPLEVKCTLDMNHLEIMCFYKTENCNLNSIDSIVNEINYNPKKFMSSLNNDSCLIKVIDEIHLQSLINNSNKYLNALNKICELGDGYVSEYVAEIVEKQLINNTFNYSKFISEDTVNSCLQTRIFESIDIGNLSKNSKNYEQIVEVIETSCEDSNFSETQKSILRVIRSRLK